MNGVHDMGGMQDMGPIQHEKDEPVFHAPWEGRIFGMVRAMGAWRKWNLDASRHERELIPPPEYLRMSYYEKFLAGLTELMVKRDLVTRAEVESGKPAPAATRVSPPITAANASASLVIRGASTRREAAAAPRFRVGQAVRARNLNPTGHTRLPRYARGKTGTVERDYGVFVFPDTNAHFLGENPQHVYSVRFSARELWGEAAMPQDAVYVDMWDDYLEPA